VVHDLPRSAQLTTLRLKMIATAHFMHNANGRFDAPIAVERPRAKTATPR
jgi:hypothetical protein